MSTDGGTQRQLTAAAMRHVLLPVMAFSLAINLLALAVPLFSIQLFNRVLSSQSTATLVALMAGVFIALGFVAVLEVVRSRMFVRFSAWLDDALSPVLFRASLRDGQMGGASLMTDLNRLKSTLSGPAVMALLDAPWAPVFLVLVFLLHPLLGWIALSGGAVLFTLAMLNEWLTRQPLARSAHGNATAMAAHELICRQATAARAMAMEGALFSWWHRHRRGVLDHQARASDRAGLIVALARFVRMGLQVVVMGSAAYLVINGELTIGAMVAASIMVARALSPVEAAIGGWRQWVGAREAWGRIRAILATEEKHDALDLPAPGGAVRVENVVIAPNPDRDPVLSEVSFTVAPGEILAISGISGAGKSSLARVLVGAVRPQGGHVRLDGADIYDWQRQGLGRHIGYVPQSVELFPGRISENIARFQPDARDEDIVAAARAAGVHEAILALENGYETLVGGYEECLSAGFRQRLMLARALYGNPHFLVLDEPYSNLDQAGLKALTAALEALKARGAAVVLIAHRPSLLTRADHVLLLEKGRGRMVERRRRAELHLLDGKAGAAAEPVRRRAAPARAKKG